MAVTIEQLAALAKTSTATVSRVLNNKPGVTEKTRQRVQNVADELGYQPSRIAQNLALQKSHVLGFVAADLQNAFYTDLFRRVQRQMEPMGYQVLIADSEQNVAKEKHNLAVMRQHRAEGLIVFPVHDWKTQTELNHFMELRLRKFPFVVIGKLNEVACDSVTNEEITSARKLTEHLLELGHREIAFIGSDLENRPVRERQRGVEAALHAARLKLKPENVVPHRHNEWLANLKALLKREKRPTALVVMNDVLALIAHRAILEEGIRIPEDISMATFGNEIWTEHLRPSLTTTDVNPEAVATLAMDMLLKRMQDKELHPTQHAIPQKLIIRESTGPAPKRR